MNVSSRVRGGLLALLLLTGACAGGGLRVSPDEIPALQARLDQRPDDADTRLRYAAALFADGRCAEARVEAETAAAVRPDNGVTPLIQGQCLEAAGQLAEAVDVYAGYIRQYPAGDGADAVRGRHLLAERALAELRAREALAAEAQVSALPPQDDLVAVLPVAILGDLDDRYAGLSTGLAQMLVSDLSLLGRLRLVERMQLNAVLGELTLGASGRVDPATAARVGRLFRAGEMVAGALVVDGDDVRLEATLVNADGARPGADDAVGDVRALLELEKRLAVSLADRLAGPLSPAEEQRILDNGPGSVDAFLVWAEGLLLEEQGDYAGAAAAYRSAARMDPGFADAGERSRRAASAVTVIGRPPTEVVGLGRVASRAAAGVSNPGLAGVLAGAARDVAALGPEIAMDTQAGVGAPWSPGAEQAAPVLPTELVLRILVRIPR